MSKLKEQIEFLKKCIPMWECQDCYTVQELQNSTKQVCIYCRKESSNWKEHIYSLMHTAFLNYE